MAASRNPWLANQFGERLEEKIAEQGYTVPGFAAQLGVAEGTVYRWLDGSRLPRQVYLPRIAETLGTTVEALLGQDQAQQLKEPFLQLVTELAERLLAGQDMAAAAVAITGEPLPAPVRERVAAATPAVVELLRKTAQKAWPLLTPEERLAVAEQLIGAASDE